MPATRALCKAFDVPHTAPHVYVGVSSVAKLVRDQQTTASQTPARKRSRQSTNKKDISAVVSAFDDAHVPALIVVIAFFTRSHQLGAPEPTEYASQRAEAIRTISKVIPEDLQRDEETNIAMVEDLLREAESGWLDMEWYHNLPEPASDADDMVDELQDPIDGEDKMAERRGQSLQVPTRGSGSMMTDATDFLSDERRAEYKRWKGGVLRRIAQIEKQGKGKAIMV
jgi:origin recognition complex subunit 6